MSLRSGTRIGPYEITAQIGAGGMGEVYRATDIHLKRAVAIKVLPALVADDPERLARFQREAEVPASHNLGVCVGPAHFAAMRFMNSNMAA
jgi:serine/threonine protein kinase